MTLKEQKFRKFSEGDTFLYNSKTNKIKIYSYLKDYCDNFDFHPNVKGDELIGQQIIKVFEKIGILRSIM